MDDGGTAASIVVLRAGDWSLSRVLITRTRVNLRDHELMLTLLFILSSGMVVMAVVAGSSLAGRRKTISLTMVIVIFFNLMIAMVEIMLVRALHETS